MPASPVVSPVVEVRWRGADLEAERRELVAGLVQVPRSIPSKYFYDERGSELFDAICDLPEYYQTRTERALLAESAAAIAERTGAGQLVELGSGMATKTRLLLDAFWGRGGLETYVPLDVDEATLRQVAHDLAHDYPGLEVHAVVGDFASHLAPLPQTNGAGPRLVIFLGGTIGNLHPEEEAPPFLARLAAAMASGDYLLLGADLIKEVTTLEAAYDDAAGVTAEFNRNILRVVNGFLDADFVPPRFAHRAFYDRERQWIEMRLVSRQEQRVTLGTAARSLLLMAGEEIRTEISAKYDLARARRLVAGSGFELLEQYTDARSYFALFLCRRSPTDASPRVNG